MLRFAEEIVLLLLHDDDGSFARVPVWLTNYALAGSVLMDLVMENRIDTDLEKLVGATLRQPAKACSTGRWQT